MWNPQGSRWWQNHQIPLKAGSIDAHELAFASKIGLTTTLLYLSLPGDKVNVPRRVGKCDMSQLKNYGDITAEHITSAMGLSARLPFCKDFFITIAQMVGLIVWHNGSVDMTMVVGLFKLEEVRAQTTLLGLKHCHIGPKHRS
jgi:hypothetical protein